MIDCDKCVYRKDGECKYKKDGCNYIPVDEPAIPISVIEQIRAEIEQYLINEDFGSAYRQDIQNIIDRHIKEYTE